LAEGSYVRGKERAIEIAPGVPTRSVVERLHNPAGLLRTLTVVACVAVASGAQLSWAQNAPAGT